MRLYTILMVLSLVGCKSSSSAGGDGGAGPGGGQGLTVLATCSDGVVGLHITCDGTQSTDSSGRTLSFAWAITGSPGTPAQTATGTDPTFSFVPQLGGTYEVTLTVSTPDGASASSKAGAGATAIPLFYRQSTIAKSADSFVVSVIGSDGVAPHELTCPVVIVDPSGGDAGAGNRGTYGDRPGAVGTRVLYVPNQAARVVFENVTATESQLLYSDESGDCSSRPPVRLDATPTAQHLVPRFSPSGARVAWIDVASPSQLITVAIDGSDRHVVRTAAKLKTAPPQWLDETHVAWVEDTSASATPNLVIASASDAAGAGDGAGRTVAVNCPAATDATALQVINQFEQVGGAWIVSGGTRSRTASPPGATLLYRLAASSCSATAATVLADEPSGSFAWDFAVSPDGTTIALAAAEAPGASAHDLFLVPVDGSVQPSRFVGSAPGVDDIGPTWIADGRQLTWTQVAVDGTASGGGLMVASRDGSSVRSVLPQGGSATASVYVAGALNRGLDCSAAGSGAALGDALLLLGALALVRRRRRA